MCHTAAQLAAKLLSSQDASVAASACGVLEAVCCSLEGREACLLARPGVLPNLLGLLTGESTGAVAAAAGEGQHVCESANCGCRWGAACGGWVMLSWVPAAIACLTVAR